MPWAEAGTIINKAGHRYKPNTIRSYERALRLRVLPESGAAKVSELRRVDLQAFANRLLAQGADPSTIQGTFMPLRAIYRLAEERGEIAVNPTIGLRLPAVRGKRDRIADPGEAAKLIEALPESEQALWATAMYAGLRRGELLALDWSAVDLAGGVIRVERSWDDKEGLIEPKSAAGNRKVPIPAVLRDHLVEHRMRRGPGVEGLVFGANPETPFNPNAARKAAKAAWKAAKLGRITLHECRHTFASLMIAAGVNAKALSVYMGHSNISTTLDRYGHLMPGNEGEAAELLDAYLIAERERAEDRVRAAEPDLAAASA